MFRKILGLILKPMLKPFDKKTVQWELEDAKPAQKEWSAEDLVDAGVDQEHLIGLQEHGDGAFVCCNGHENILKQYECRFPFKYVKCGRCDHTLCTECHTTDILEPYTATMPKTVALAHIPHGRICAVCDSCGLTHRPVRMIKEITFNRVCQCGEKLQAALFMNLFLVGDAYEFHCDPTRQAFEVNMQYTEAASRRAAKACCENQTRCTRSEPSVLVKWDPQTD